ncbi:ATP-binding protein [Aliiglaciecola sp. SL4]|uniref:ATP-binding protein n=1 Tax=Aliiglaciecola sp. SL4 TaxID=3239806 RepID=UPI00355BCE04
MQAQTKALSIDLEIANEIKANYHGVADRIRQILTNLLGDAVTFTENGNITIKLSKHADETMSRRSGGTGLGTIISKQLVELIGGSIYATSQLYVGSTFCFILPPKKCREKVKLEKFAPTKLPKLRILVVDDLQHNIDLMFVLLTRAEHTAFAARDAKQVLFRKRNDLPDVVLLDSLAILPR